MGFFKKEKKNLVEEEFLKTQREIEKKLGYAFSDEKLLFSAFIHRSFLHENKDWLKVSYERLEFLGDSVLGLLITDYLYHRFAEKEEGELSMLHARLVEAKACCFYFETWELQEYIFLGKGEKKTASRGKTSIFADVFEALVGAMYLDAGWKKMKSLLIKKLEGCIEKVIQDPLRNYKAEIQEYSQKKFQEHPLYQVESEEGLQHEKIFLVTVFFAGKIQGKGKGSSKKEAEQEAARDALEVLRKRDKLG